MDVECFYATGHYYEATLTKHNSNGNWNVIWKNGKKKDRENHPREHIKNVLSANNKDDDHETSRIDSSNAI